MKPRPTKALPTDNRTRARPADCLAGLAAEVGVRGEPAPSARAAGQSGEPAGDDPLLRAHLADPRLEVTLLRRELPELHWGTLNHRMWNADQAECHRPPCRPTNAARHP